MLLINWEVFNPSDKSGKYEAEIKHYEMATKGIKNKYGSLGFVRFLNTQVADDLHGLPIPPCTLPLTARDGLVEWAYTENAGNIRRTKDGVVTLTRKSKMMKQGELNINVEKDIDLLYFIIEKSPLFKKGFIKIDDIREQQEEKVKKEKNAIKLKAAIYGEASPLTSEPMLRQVCHSLGISGADKATENALRIKLESFIDAENKRKDVRGMTTENFLEFINANDEIMRRGIVGKAVARKIVEFSKMHGWMWAASKETITRVPDARYSDKFPYLCEFFGNENNKEVFDALIRELCEQGYFEDEQPYEELKWLAKMYGIKTSQVNKTDLAGKIKENFKA
jgi:hypothetical protein